MGAKSNPDLRPGNPYPFQGELKNPFADVLKEWSNVKTNPPAKSPQDRAQFNAGTTSIQAADENGWVISVTPSGG